MSSPSLRLRLAVYPCRQLVARRAPEEIGLPGRHTPLTCAFTLWARGDLNPHVLSDTGT
jgi:hypothetical protein